MSKLAEERWYRVTDLCIDVWRKEKLLLHSCDRATIHVKMHTLDKFCWNKNKGNQDEFVSTDPVRSQFSLKLLHSVNGNMENSILLNELDFHVVCNLGSTGLFGCVSIFMKKGLIEMLVCIHSSIADADRAPFRNKYHTLPNCRKFMSKADIHYVYSIPLSHQRQSFL